MCFRIVLALLLSLVVSSCLEKEEETPQPQPEPLPYQVEFRMSATDLPWLANATIRLINSRPDIDGWGFALSSSPSLAPDSRDNYISVGYSGYTNFSNKSIYLYYRETPTALRYGMKRGERTSLELVLGIDPARVREPQYANTVLDLVILANRTVVQRVQLRPATMTPSATSGYETAVPFVVDADTF